MRHHLVPEEGAEMRESSALIFILFAAAVATAMPRVASAQGSGTIECGAKSGARRHCAVAGIDPEGVTLDEMLSRTICVRGQNWGADAKGIWVSGGCRARFAYIRSTDGGQRTSTSAMMSACIRQASRQWGVAEANLEITAVSPQANGTTEVAVQSPRTQGHCVFDAQGGFVRLATR